MAVTTAAVVGIAAGGGQAVMGCMNAAKQKQAAAKAEKQAKKMMARIYHKYGEVRTFFDLFRIYVEEINNPYNWYDRLQR